MRIQIRSSRHSPINRMALNSLYVCSLLAILPATVIASTGASKAAETASVKISFAGFDLATPVGLRATRERVAAAALRACERFWDSRKVDDRETVNLWYQTALAKAMQHLNALLAATGANRSEVAQNIR
jgi:UrcA family protein